MGGVGGVDAVETTLSTHDITPTTRSPGYAMHNKVCFPSLPYTHGNSLSHILAIPKLLADARVPPQRSAFFLAFLHPWTLSMTLFPLDLAEHKDYIRRLGLRSMCTRHLVALTPSYPMSPDIRIEFSTKTTDRQ
jgi:hypothetical protein